MDQLLDVHAGPVVNLSVMAASNDHENVQASPWALNKSLSACIKNHCPGFELHKKAHAQLVKEF